MKSSMNKICLFLSIVLLSNCSSGDKSRVVIVTNYGSIELQLYDRTPAHSANFVKLATEGYYDGLLFHRVIKNFKIQGGDPDSRSASSDALLGSGGLEFCVPAEFVPESIHKRGALAAYRLEDNLNPERASGAQFFIVQGRLYTDAELDQAEVEIGEGLARDRYFQFFAQEEAAMVEAGDAVNSDSIVARATRRASAWLLENPYRMRSEDREVYKTIGGIPLFDGEYTVFGEVIKGLNVVDKIAELETGVADRPKVDVRIKRIRVK